MNCREITEILSEFVAGELPADAAALLDAHLILCPNCCVFLVQFRQTVEVARAAGVDVADPDDIPEELVTAVLAVIKTEDR